MEGATFLTVPATSCGIKQFGDGEEQTIGVEPLSTILTFPMGFPRRRAVSPRHRDGHESGIPGAAFSAGGISSEP